MLDEIKNAQVLQGEEWKIAQPRLVFKTEDGTLYYKKLDGSIMNIERMSELILNKIEKKSGIIQIRGV